MAPGADAATSPTARRAAPAGARRGRGEPAARRARPAVVFDVRVDADGAVDLDGAERSIVRSRAKLAYETVTGRRPARRASTSWRAASSAAEAARVAPRGSSPPSRRSRRRRRRATRLRSARGCGREDAELGAVAGDQPRRRRRAARRRHRPVPRDGRARRASRAAAAPHRPRARHRLAGDTTLADVRARARPGRPDARGVPARHAPRRRRRDLRPVRADACRGTRRWRRPTPTPPHRCAGSPTATSSRRRSRSRNGGPVPDWVAAAFAELPEVMERADGPRSQIERAVVDLAEAIAAPGPRRARRSPRSSPTRRAWRADPARAILPSSPAVDSRTVSSRPAIRSVCVVRGRPGEAHRRASSASLEPARRSARR